jgi:hypothetical protein
LGRRDFVHVGALTGLGLGLSSLVRGTRKAHAQTGAQKPRRCILIWLDGGPSHLDTFDPKPSAPEEIRGPFASIRTNVAGIQLSELLPETARIVDRVTIIRSMTSTLGEHNFGTHYLLSGYRPTPALQYPSFGSVLAHLRQQPRLLPANIAIPDFRVGGGTYSSRGFLPTNSAPFEVGGDPSRPEFAVRDLEFYPRVDLQRIERRRQYRTALDRFMATMSKSPSTEDWALDQAYRLLASEEARKAFDVSRETAAVRQRYGHKSIGQSCLLARRLIERGVDFVTVNNTGWDTHNDQYTRLKEGFTGAKVPVGLVPSLDLAFSALVDDLQQRGLLSTTLVVVMGEFGRTPRVNTNGGRDHWPRVFSVLLAGGGIPGGQIIGRSDDAGESPAERPVTPSDLAASIYLLLGIDSETSLRTPDGRPVAVNRDGTPILELVG